MAENPSRLKLALLLAPLPLVLLLFYVLPFAGVVGWSFSLPTPGIEQYQRIASDPAIHDVLWRTFRLCTTVSVVSLLIAYLMAYCWVYSPPFWQRMVEICVFIPFWLSVLVRAFGWLIALRSNGLLNGWLQALGDNPRLIDSMSKGVSAVAKGVSKRGTNTTDTYSLAGFSDALAKIHATCNM